MKKEILDTLEMMFFRINENEMKKILVLAYFVISCYFNNSSWFVISLNFDKQFQEMMYEFKIKPIRGGRESRVPQIVITATQICFAASALLNW